MKNHFVDLPGSVPKRRPGTSFVCETCCDQGVLESVGGGMVVYHCDLHMTLCIKDNEVLWAQTNGIRQ